MVVFSEVVGNLYAKWRLWTELVIDSRKGFVIRQKGSPNKTWTSRGSNGRDAM